MNESQRFANNLYVLRRPIAADRSNSKVCAIDTAQDMGNVLLVSWTKEDRHSRRIRVKADLKWLVFFLHVELLGFTPEALLDVNAFTLTEAGFHSCELRWLETEL